MDAASDMRSLEQLKALGSGRSAPAEVVLVIAESLRRGGNMNSRTLAVEIERACRAAL